MQTTSSSKRCGGHTIGRKKRTEVVSPHRDKQRSGEGKAKRTTIGTKGTQVLA